MSLDAPQMTEQRLTEIENDLAIRQNAYEAATRTWFKKLGSVTKAKAIAYRKADGGATDKREAANEEYGEEGSTEQAEYEALRVVVRLLESRATIGMSLLKSQGRS